ncbi:hypothetical protein A1E_03890 [Rickettsia canadensis str. McKiel]|uniref:Uncharacterized protein n=1 Tax=Rickettsia canadensis (strain McKiel) TaxID=293613 RepID=A8EZC2_RICCK|nr:hypothetical protein [Rickettsia canadensis]ABV73705.1 hypothetical protein A1E_03890 [Rickettsia canadensis str. McKiel]
MYRVIGFLPYHEGINDKMEFNIEWNNISDSWKAISDYGISKSFKFKVQKEELFSTLYVAGYKIVYKKNPVYLFLQG